MLRNITSKLAVGSMALVATGAANAAVPASVTDALTAALADVTTVAAAVIAIVVTIAAFRYMKRAF